MNQTSTLKYHYTFIPDGFKILSWDNVSGYYENLLKREIHSLNDLEQWISDRNELGETLYEENTWRYIKMTTDTTNPDYKRDYELFVGEIDPHVKSAENELDKKFLASPFATELDSIRYYNYLRDSKALSSIYRDINLPLITEMQLREQEYGSTVGAMTIIHEGKELTMYEASKLLYENDRSLRENIYKKIMHRRAQDRDKLNELFDDLVKLRHQIAHNAGEANYRDYKFKQLRRYDYTYADCIDFHKSILHSFVPAVYEVTLHRKKQLGFESLRPWDLMVEINHSAPAHPFSNAEELFSKTLKVMQSLDPYFADCLSTMHSLKRLDLDSRKGKAPGGYNCSLPVSGVPFIFMNSAGTANDVVTMVHESGHAIHSFLSREIPLHIHKEVPSEIAELASMSMELFTMPYWDIYYKDPVQLRRARINQLERVLDIFPWVAVVDSFQHWVYENPTHTHQERLEKWTTIYENYNHDKGLINWQGIETAKQFMWQKQLHIFEVPFYYIEYAMAQLGAIALWKIYKENPGKALEGYKKALSLGYTHSIQEVYEAAGIRFDFSAGYVNELADFVLNEWRTLIKEA